MSDEALNRQIDTIMDHLKKICYRTQSQTVSDLMVELGNLQVNLNEELYNESAWNIETLAEDRAINIPAILNDIEMAVLKARDLDTPDNDQVSQFLSRREGTSAANEQQLSGMEKVIMEEKRSEELKERIHEYLAGYDRKIEQILAFHCHLTAQRIVAIENSHKRVRGR